MLKNTFKIIILTTTLLSTLSLNAQDLKEKQLLKIELAERALKGGNHKQAKNHIEELYTSGNIDPSLSNRFEYLRGRIYTESLFLPNAKRELNQIQLASNAFLKVQSDEDVKNKYKELAAIRHENLWGELVNRGIESYSANENEEAMFYFMGAQKVKPTDTLSFLYAGVVAQQIKDWALVYENFNKLLEMDYYSSDVYSTLAYIEETINNNPDKALSYTQDGIKHNPKDNALVLNEINLLLKLNKTDEAKSRIKSALRNQTNNASLHYDLGYLYEKSGDERKAIKYYQKALTINAEHEKSLYNLAVIHYNKAADIYKEIAVLSTDKKKSKGKRMEQKADKSLNASLVHFEKLHKLNKTDKIVNKALYKIYSKLGMEEKLDELAPYIEKGLE